MAIAVSERISTPTPDPLWWRAVTYLPWKNMKTDWLYPLDEVTARKQAEIAQKNKELHALARRREKILFPLALAFLAVVGAETIISNKDRVVSALGLSRANSEPNPTNVAGVSQSTLEASKVLKTQTPTPTNTEIPPTPKPIKISTSTPFPTVTNEPTRVPTEKPAQFQPAEAYINDPNGQWIDAGPGRHIWKKAPQILVSFGGTAYEYGSIAGVVFKEIIMAEDGLQKALFGFNRGEDKYLFTVAVVPATCKSDKGYTPSGFDLLRDENGVNLYPIYKGSPKAILVNAGPCVVVNNLKVAQVDHIDAYFAGQKRDQAGKILDLSDQLALNDVR